MKLLTSILVLVLYLTPSDSFAQGGYHFGIKGGPTLANQTWNNAERRFTLTYHVAGFIESRDPEGRGALYAQLGLHNRGSSLGITNFNSRWNYNFKNVSLELGAKKTLDTEIMNGVPYYFVGIRGEYNVSNNMEAITDNFLQISFANPLIDFTNFTVEDPVFLQKFVYGISIGGGLQFYGSEFFNTGIEMRISPDIGFQYDRIISANSRTQIRNVSFEVSLVMRFLREIVYE